MGRVVGEVRDYNGGMICKLNESLGALKAALGKGVDPILLEKFFYSIVPIEMRSSLETEPLKQFFNVLLQAMKTDAPQKKQDASRAYFVAPRRRRVPELEVPSQKVVSFVIEIHQTPYLGCMILSEDKEEQEKFLKAFNFS